MHTVLVIGCGLLLLGACVLVGRLAGGPAALPTSLLVFLPLWFVGAGINLYVGVTRAGYSVAEEAPVFLVTFSVPAALTLVLWWSFR
jgi:hypothetical protein